MSDMKAAAVVPVGVRAVTPLVMEAGLTPVAALVGSTKLVSMNATMDFVKSSRTKASAEGSLARANSSVITTMPAILAKSRVIESKARALSGFGAASPTQLTVDSAVWRGTRTLNGTLVKPGMRPMIVNARKNSANWLVKI